MCQQISVHRNSDFVSVSVHRNSDFVREKLYRGQSGHIPPVLDAYASQGSTHSLTH